MILGMWTTKSEGILKLSKRMNAKRTLANELLILVK